MPNQALRLLDAHDTQAFLELKRIGLSSDPDAFVATLEDDPPQYPESVRARLSQASVESGDVILGAFDPQLIGIVAVTREDRRKRQHKANLHGMYVVPAYRGRGLGTALLHRVLDLACAMRGLEEIQLVVASHSVQVVGLYERCGFERVWTEQRALRLEDRYVDAHHMVLDLLRVRGKTLETVGAV
jgi:RimJ/RimL family protein N-acetyltransferase